MKLNWFSPLPPANTGIAEYTTYVLPALRKYAEVVLWTDQPSWSSEIEQYASVRYYESNNLSWADINQADLNIYHIGNNPIFNGAIWKVSRQCSGLVILHEFRLHDLFVGLYWHHFHDREAYLDQMMRHYGSVGRQAAERIWSAEVSVESMAEEYPLTPLALENSVGAITHTKEGFDKLKQQKRCFVGYTPLPYLGKRELSRNSKTKEPPYRLVMFGHIGSNRRLDIFLEALSTLPEKSYFCVDIYGQIWDRDYIDSQVEKLNLRQSVTLHGFVEEGDLDSALANAHLAINLRYPTMGEASLSQLRIWSHALPSLVTQVGWYAELPENTVAFIRPEYEIEDIQKQLRNFLANPDEFIEMGRNGQRTLEDKHNPEVYAQAIVNFANTVRILRHRSVAYKLVERVGEQISIWSEGNILDAEIKRVAEAIHFISE